jgi:hypothetical protein
MAIESGGAQQGLNGGRMLACTLCSGKQPIFADRLVPVSTEPINVGQRFIALSNALEGPPPPYRIQQMLKTLGCAPLALPPTASRS